MRKCLTWLCCIVVVLCLGQVMESPVPIQETEDRELLERVEVNVWTDPRAESGGTSGYRAVTRSTITVSHAIRGLMNHLA